MKKKITFLLLLCFVASSDTFFWGGYYDRSQAPENFYPAQALFARGISFQENRQFPGFLTFSSPRLTEAILFGVGEPSQVSP